MSTSVGLRAAEAYVRPSPIYTVGSVLKYGFDLKNCTFSFSLESDRATSEELYTLIYLPDFHFPPSATSVQVSGGKWTIDVEDVDGESMQWLKWWHGQGEQNITIKGVNRKLGSANEDEEVDEGYWQTLTQNCNVM